jgi:hypothetical protein
MTIQASPLLAWGLIGALVFLGVAITFLGAVLNGITKQ